MRIPSGSRNNTLAIIALNKTQFPAEARAFVCTRVRSAYAHARHTPKHMSIFEKTQMSAAHTRLMCMRACVFVKQWRACDNRAYVVSVCVENRIIIV